MPKFSDNYISDFAGLEGKKKFNLENQSITLSDKISVALIIFGYIYYMNVANLHKSELGRKLYSEVAMIEEQHVTGSYYVCCEPCEWISH